MQLNPSDDPRQDLCSSLSARRCNLALGIASAHGNAAMELTLSRAIDLALQTKPKPQDDATWGSREQRKDRSC